VLLRFLFKFDFSFPTNNSLISSNQVEINRSKQSTYLRQMQSVTNALLCHDTRLLAQFGLPFLKSLPLTYLGKYRAVKSLADKMSTENGAERGISGISEILDDFECTDILGSTLSIGACKGNNNLAEIYISLIQNLVASYSNTSSPNDETYQKLHYIETNYLRPNMNQVVDLLSENTLSTMRTFRAIIYSLFAAGIVSVLCSYFLAAKPFDRLLLEHKKIAELFLLLPIKVVEENPDIKMLLTTGKINQGSGEESLDLQIEATQTKTERILQASADAVIIFDATTLKVEVFNAAAEKMFGYTSDHMIGKEVTNIIPSDAIEEQRLILEKRLKKIDDEKEEQERLAREKSAESEGKEKGKKDDKDKMEKMEKMEKKDKKDKDKKETNKKSKKEKRKSMKESEEDAITDEELEQSMDVTATHSDGTKIPVTLSMSSSGTTCALFIRDMRDIKGYQNLIEMNETLLQKILPKSIAMRLKDIIMRDEPVAIADNHDKTSILFADMVKFTNWSSTMEPAALVRILNGIVSAWDTLAMKFGVEKIKTIGDCYMAVCGCPEPNPAHADAMIAFADAMILALKDFNIKNKTDLHIRVGIHSGPVLAGVIGLNKILYDIWGRAVSTAARMESSGEKDSIHVCFLIFFFFSLFLFFSFSFHFFNISNRSQLIHIPN